VDNEWAEEIPDASSRLREATLIALASLTLHLDSIRRDLLLMSPSYLDLVMQALDDSCVGVRYAACQCARALSRSVEVLRTSAIDSGLGMKLWLMLKAEKDRRVQMVLLMCMANLVLDFSPVRETLLDQGVITRIVELVDTGDKAVKRNAVWAISNTLYNCHPQVHRLVLNQLGMERFYSVLTHADAKVKEQAITLLRNTTTCEDNCAFVVEGLGRSRVFHLLRDGVDGSDNVTVLQSVNVLLNLAQDTEYSGHFREHKDVLTSLKTRLPCRDQDTKKAILATIIALAVGSQEVLHEVGFVMALKETIHEMEMNVSLGGDTHEETALRELARSALFSITSR